MQRPIDPDLPSLTIALDAAAMSEQLHLTLGHAELLKHKPGRRAVIRYPVSGDPSGMNELFVKVLAKPRADRIARRTSAFAAVDLPGVRTPRVLGVAGDGHWLAIEGLAGEPIEQTIISGNTLAAFRAGAAIAAVHASAIPLSDRHRPEDELAATARQLHALSAVDDALYRDALGVLERVAQNLGSDTEWEYRPAHRDFHPGQVLLDGQNIALIDLDDACLTDPAVDTGNMLAHLDLAGILWPAHIDLFHTATTTFLEGYQSVGPAIPADRLRRLTGVAQLRLVGVHAGRSGLQVGKELLRLARASLDEAS